MLIPWRNWGSGPPQKLCVQPQLEQAGENLREYVALAIRVFDRLELAAKEGNCSLSDGMRRLIAEGRLRALEIGEGRWQDLDTPEALAHAEAVFDPYLHHQPGHESVARV